MILKDIIVLIAAAQIASDAGKYERYSELIDLVKRFDRRTAGYAVQKAYAAKDALIRRAVYLIDKEHPKDVHYYYGHDDYGHVVVYFNMHVGGKRLQCSFHCPFNDNAARRSMKSRNDFTHATHWDHKSSRGACIEALRLLLESDASL